MAIVIDHQTLDHQTLGGSRSFSLFGRAIGHNTTSSSTSSLQLFEPPVESSTKSETLRPLNFVYDLFVEDGHRFKWVCRCDDMCCAFQPSSGRLTVWYNIWFGLWTTPCGYQHLYCRFPPQSLATSHHPCYKHDDVRCSSMHSPN